ncbi:hypothetical protein KHQ84_gp030 [Rhodococcus phage Finch]|uniref:Uncharacterized protein n=1 Tax=Rhodococcus phage Finch TaxID=2094144 RepID=A0A2P1JXB1_9CAUD|nr:hypothetical protein KHQ84_gp030 [Rhodococcus phage Finch]AVO24971.1 hypothetical protein SEA_FINCH_30 [Rhodococcus phage Finch]
MSAPISPRKVAIADADGVLDESFMPEYLTPESLEPPVDLVLVFENALA